MANLKNDFESDLLNAQTYREFLNLFFKAKNPSGTKAISYQQFASRAGYASKSYISDVLSGKKGLVPVSFSKICAGLGLINTWSDYFYCLIALEEPKFRQKESLAYYEKKISKLRKKLNGAAASTWFAPETEAAAVTLEENCTDVCVAIGDPVKGALEAEIRKKTSLSSGEVNSALNKLRACGLVRFDENTRRFHNVPLATNIRHRYADSKYQNFMQATSRRALARMASASEIENLFGTQTLTIKRAGIPALVKKLNRAVREAADEADDSDGEGLAEIIVMVTHNFK